MDCTVYPLPCICAYLGDFYFLRHSFLPDATVRSLCEIWSPHDIPAVFLTQACVTMPLISMQSILPLMDRLIPPSSLHSPNNYPHRPSHCHIYQALLPLLTFPWHFISFPTLQLIMTFLLPSRPMATLPHSRLLSMRFCVIHKLRAACFKLLFATLRPFVRGSLNLSTKSKLAKKSMAR